MNSSFNKSYIEKDDICRICLEKKTLPTYPFKKYDILDKINLCFHIVLQKDHNLPSAICSDCLSELETALKFRKKCLTVNERFKQLSKEIIPVISGNDSMNKLPEEDISNFNFPSSENEENSLNNVVEEDGNHRIFQCLICKKILKSDTSLKKHNMSMHLKRKHLGRVTGTGPSRRYHCTKCTYNTPHSQTLANHMRRHNGDRPYRCECGKTFTQSSSLAAHYKTHSDTTFYTCTICGKQFKHAFTLKKHQHVHEDGKFLCNICNKYLKSRQSLQDHIHRHYNVRNYSCEDCGDTFVTSSELFNHRKKHSLDKKVECHLCGYKTHTKKNLIIHLKRHAGEKSHKCVTCSVSFYTQGDLQRHQRVHTREKPYVCPTCSQRFTHSPSLNKHMLTVHGVVYKWADFKWKESKKDKVQC